jgi:hypothetical protein
VLVLDRGPNLTRLTTTHRDLPGFTRLGASHELTNKAPGNSTDTAGVSFSLRDPSRTDLAFWDAVKMG